MSGGQLRPWGMPNLVRCLAFICRALLERNSGTTDAMRIPMRRLELVYGIQADFCRTSFASDTVWSNICSIGIILQNLPACLLLLAFRPALGISRATRS